MTCRTSSDSPFGRGWNAYLDGAPETANPYSAQSQYRAFLDWGDGWSWSRMVADPRASAAEIGRALAGAIGPARAHEFLIRAALAAQATRGQADDE